MNSNSPSFPVHMLGTNNPKLCSTGETKEVVDFDCFPAQSSSIGTLARPLSTLSPSLAMASTQSSTAGPSTGMALFPPGTVLEKRTLKPVTEGYILNSVYARGTGCYHTLNCENIVKRMPETAHFSVALMDRIFTPCKCCTVLVPEHSRAGIANSTTQVTGNLIDGFTVLDTVTRVQSLVSEQV